MTGLKNLLGKTFRVLVLAMVLLAIALQHADLRSLMADPGDRRGPDLVAEAAHLFPGAASLGGAADVPVRPVLDASGVPLGRLVDVRTQAADHPGFGGPIPLLVGLSRDDRVVGLRLLPNAETLSFIDRLAADGFFDRWNGLPLAEAAVLDTDAVTGATKTSVAVAATVRDGLTPLTGAPASAASDSPLPWSRWLRDGASLLIVLAALASFFRPATFRRWRWLLLLASVGFLGVVQGQLLSIALGFGWLVHGVSLVGHPVMITVALVAVLLPLLTNRSFYCQHLCPFGAAQELIGRVSPLRARRPELLRRAIRFTRPAAPGAVAFLLLLGVSLDLSAFEPFSAFLPRSASIAALTLGGVSLALAALFPKFWCRALCPTGFVLEILRRRPPQPAAPAQPEATTTVRPEIA